VEKAKAKAQEKHEGFERLKEPERAKEKDHEVRPDNPPKTETPLPRLCTANTAENRTTGRIPVFRGIQSWGRSGSPLCRADRPLDPLNKGIFHTKVPKNPELILPPQKIKPMTTKGK